LPRLRNRAT